MSRDWQALWHRLSLTLPLQQLKRSVRDAGMRNCKQNKLLGEQTESCCEWPLIHQPKGEVQPSPEWINSEFLFYVLPVQVRGLAAHSCTVPQCSVWTAACFGFISTMVGVQHRIILRYFCSVSSDFFFSIAQCMCRLHQKLLSWWPAGSRHPKILFSVFLLGANILVLE